MRIFCIKDVCLKNQHLRKCKRQWHLWRVRRTHINMSDGSYGPIINKQVSNNHWGAGGTGWWCSVLLLSWLLLECLAVDQLTECLQLLLHLLVLPGLF